LSDRDPREVNDREFAVELAPADKRIPETSDQDGFRPTIELSRVASGQADQVPGVVFLGSEPFGQIGRSVTGEVDLNGDGTADVIFSGSQEAWLIPGNGPKTQSGSSPATKDPTVSPSGLIRFLGSPLDALTHFGATFFTAGTAANLGPLVVGGAGDVNDDGVQDLIIGAPDADLPGKAGAGKAYLVYGSRVFQSGEIRLSDVGITLPGSTVEGFEAGDHLGTSVGGGFDVNADGIADALVGAPFADSLASTPADAGETYIISPVASGLVSGLTLAPSVPATTTFLEWAATPRAFTYNVYRGAISTLVSSGKVLTSETTKLACGINTDSDNDQHPDTLDPAIPAAGVTFFYLVTGENLTGEGPLGPPAALPPRINDSQCP
jgi:FG-GAP repeat protein